MSTTEAYNSGRGDHSEFATCSQEFAAVFIGVAIVVMCHHALPHRVANNRVNY